MDEPLSNLDAKLRVEMRSAIREVQERVGITTVYVTHDQEEALAISDRIAVMKDGIIQQVGEPHTIYTRPANVFVSTFIGHSNLFQGTVSVTSEGKFINFKSGYNIKMNNLVEEVTDNMSVCISVRPEEFSISREGITAKIKNKTFLGKYITYELTIMEDMILPSQPSIEFSQDIGHAERIYKIGDEITLKPNYNKINIFTKEGTDSLIKDVKKYE